MEFELETIYTFQVYGFLIVAGFCVFMLYGYFYYIYAAERKGDKDYEKYRNIALDDNLDSTPLETTSPWDKKNKKEIKHV